MELEYRDFGEDERALIDGIYAAALDETLWTTALEPLRVLADAVHVNIIFHDAQNRTRNRLIIAGPTTYSVDAYLSNVIDSDIRWARMIFKGVPEGMALSNSRSITQLGEIPVHLMPPELKDFYVNAANYGDQVFSTLIMSNFITAGLSINREMGQAPFSENIDALLNRLGPHLCRALRIHNQLSIAHSENWQLLQALEKTAVGVALLDFNGAVIFANRESARILEQHPAVKIGQGGRLQATSPRDNSTLQQCIEDTQAVHAGVDSLNKKSVSIPLFHEQHTHPLKITVLPLGASGIDTALAQPNICTAVFMTDPERDWHIADDYLQSAYQLTETECIVSQALVNGAAIRDIADQREITQETARWHLKNIQQKTGAHSQTELSKLFINLSSDFSRPID